jgi:hypothetical protein
MPAILEVVPQVETESETKSRKESATIPEEKPVSPAPKRRTLLQRIFEGHEEYLGYTPD